ncbi:MAG TPA: EAL domain-containing protein [Verrucomicrobiae bacterium]|nr:EAL domain-containing protein [Verrucomicrobiae bacterium]
MVSSAPRTLREDHDRLERVLEASGLGLWELDLASGEFCVDARCARNLGYEPERLDASWNTGVAIIHPDDAVRVSRLFEAHLRGQTATLRYKTRMLTEARTWTWVAGHGRLVRDATGRPTHISGSVKNIDAERAMRAQLAHTARRLRHQSVHDPLTGLINRRGFEKRLSQLLQSARGHQRVHALCYLDLDHFKLVNDTCGHAAGDELLCQLPQVLRPVVRRPHALARLGGDEFALLLEDCPLDQAARIAEAARDAIRDFRFAWQGRFFAIGASVGVVGIDASTQGLGPVLGAADAACYIAKDQGSNQVHVSYPHDLAILRRRGEMRMVTRIKTALEENRFRLQYMSIAPLDGAIEPRHHELLLRMLDSRGELILPGTFLPAAERYQLMPLIDRWVIDHALRFLGEALKQAPGLAQHCFGINLSGESLRDSQLLDTIRQWLAQHAVPASMVYFELTETAAIANLGAAVEFMRGLKALGCQLALDDFGSGMSSFAYLKQLPVDYLKIDGGFIKDIVENPVDQAIVRAVQSVGSQMGIATIAEYVETPAIREALRTMGLHYAQGYAIAFPADLADFPLLRQPRAAASL